MVQETKINMFLCTWTLSTETVMGIALSVLDFWLIMRYRSKEESTDDTTLQKELIRGDNIVDFGR